MQKQLGITPDQHVELMDGQRCGVGDVVRLRKNDYGLNVFNGMAGIVMEVNPDGVRVKLGDREVTLPAAYCKEGLQLGYAITADSSQGLTVEQAIVMVDGMDYRRVYVAATRSRRPPLYVASSLQALGTALATRDEHTPPHRRGHPPHRRGHQGAQKRSWHLDVATPFKGARIGVTNDSLYGAV